MQPKQLYVLNHCRTEGDVVYLLNRLSPSSLKMSLNDQRQYFYSEFVY